MSGMDWTPEIVSTLVNMWGAGKSCGDISKVLGVSRSAIAGKIGRLKLQRRKKVERKIRPSRKGALNRSRMKQPKAWADFAAPKDIRPIEIELEPTAVEPHRGVFALRRGECKWPHNHPGGPDFHFCAQPAERDRPYCAFHCHMAYRIV